METKKSWEREEIEKTLIKLLEEMTSDWDLDFSGGISASTRIIEDLGFESIDVVQLVTSIEDTYHKKNLPFEKILMKDGYYVNEIPVYTIVDFLYNHLNE